MPLFYSHGNPFVDVSFKPVHNNGLMQFLVHFDVYSIVESFTLVYNVDNCSHHIL